MAAILLSGGPGAGKSTVSNHLRGCGLRSIDLDFGYARHEDRTGAVVSLPESPGLAWLEQHHWNWLDDRLTTALAESARQTTVLAGSAYNMADHLHRFDLLLLLHIDSTSVAARVRDPSRDNVFGKTGDTAAWSETWHRTVEALLRRHGANIIDGKRLIEYVVADVIATCAAHDHPIAACE